MELKCLIVVGIVGLCNGYAIPDQGSGSDLESSFGSSLTDFHGSAELSRERRGLLFKKLKKHSSSDSVYVNRGYQGDYRPNREIHHHHHYSYPPPPQSSYPVQSFPAPNHEYHHYHGGAAGGYQAGGYQAGGYQAGGYQAGGWNHGSSYSSGSSYGQTNYADGGYAHYGGVGGYHQPPPPQGPISAAPFATAHNNVDRGQGAAAVNNIAIIHARNGGHSSDLVESESKLLPKPLPIDIDDALNMMADH